MAATASIQVLLKFYAIKQNSPFILYNDFCSYIKRYAQHNVEEQAYLVPYLGNAEPQVAKELESLIETQQVVILNKDSPKQTIFVSSFIATKLAERYKEIDANSNTPFPTIADLPKHTPHEILSKQNSSDIISTLIEKQQKDDKHIYALIAANDISPIIFPGSVPVSVLINASINKIRTMLRKEEFHDYFLKKLRISNPGKEISAKNFFAQFVLKPNDTLKAMQTTGDNFYFWSQLCYFIKKDYEKVKDFTQEDINILQSVSVAEIVMSCYKNESQKNLQRETALNNLKNVMQKPPYYFTMDTILKFTDSRGVPLYGQFSDADLKKFLEKETTDSEANELPALLVFRVESGLRYFIYKDKVIPLVVRLCNEAHDSVSDSITRKWFFTLKDFNKLPEMKDDASFNHQLEAEIRTLSPVLYSLLNANFLPILNLEMTKISATGAQISIFSGDQMLPLSTLLMLNRNDILSNARIMLPFWYTIPLVSWVLSFLFKKPKSKKTGAKKSVENEVQQTEKSEEEQTHKNKTTKPRSRKDALIEAAEKVEKHYVPEGSSLERELNAYRKQWNKMITKEANLNLTEDVNSLIRDYTRKVLRTISAISFTADRIQNLAETLVNTPNMQKITEHDSLYMYVQLYMVFLVKNM